MTGGREERRVSGEGRFGGRPSTTRRLRDEILAVVAERDLVPGDQLPTEQMLAEFVGVSRSTIREALKSLEQDGLVRAVQGKGRFLSALGSLRVERPVTKYESITQMLEGLGYTVTNAVLAVEIGPATKVEADSLRIGKSAEVIRLTRLRFGDDDPMVFSINTVPRRFLPGPLTHRDWSGSLAKALEIQGHQIVSSSARISAVDVPEEYASRHDLAQFDPWLLVEETCITASGDRVVYANDYHRGSCAFHYLRGQQTNCPRTHHRDNICRQ